MQIKSFSFLSALILGATIGLGALGAGFFIAKAVYKARATDNYVSVKGLSEHVVKANLAAWEIDYRELDNNLADAITRLEHDQQLAINYLKNNNFSIDEMEVRPAKVTDLFANPYTTPNPDQTKFRYIVTGGVRIRSPHVDQVQKVSQNTTELIKAGVPVSFDAGDYNTDLSPNPSYYFTDLDSIRPEMLDEATHSARSVAEQFAKDSGSYIGVIRRANQGVFQIFSRDAVSDSSTPAATNQASSIYKKIRLVTTIDYLLKSDRVKSDRVDTDKQVAASQ